MLSEWFNVEQRTGQGYVMSSCLFMHKIYAKRTMDEKKINISGIKLVNIEIGANKYHSKKNPPIKETNILQELQTIILLTES